MSEGANHIASVAWQRHCDALMDGQKKELLGALRAVEAHLEATDKAVEVAKQGLDRRLEAMNEFRGALKEQSQHFVTQGEHDFVLADIRELRESRAKLEGMATQKSVYIAYAISIGSLMLSVIEIVIGWRG